MDAHCEAILSQYRDDAETFEIIKGIVLDQLNAIIERRGMLVNAVEARVKTEQSLSGKLELKGHKYRTLFDITDIVGARVVTFYDDEVDLIANDVEQAFDIDWENSVDKRKMYDPDRFGYMSLHYIGRIPKSLYDDPEHPYVNEYRFEVQMRTTLQHVWATIYHDTGYKSDIEVPSLQIRQLNRLASLLELADAEFHQIRDNVDDYRTRMRALMSEKRYDEIELNGDTWREYLRLEPFAPLTQRIAAVNNAEIEPMGLLGFMPVMRTLGLRTIADVEALIADYSDDAFAYAKSMLTVTDVDIVSESVGLHALALVYLVRNNMGVRGLTRYYDAVNGVRDKNEGLAKRALARANRAGIVARSEE